MIKRNVEPNLNGEEKRINKEKIVKYASVILTGTIVFGGVGICAVDATIDHTKEICPITSSLTSFNNDQVFNYGLNHQINHMESDYIMRGYDVGVNYNSEDNTFLAYLPKDEDEIEVIENVRYVVPSGYTLGFNDGKAVAFKTEKIYASPIETQDELGNVIYMAPVGYTLETREDGSKICVKIITKYIKAMAIEKESLELKLTKGE